MRAAGEPGPATEPMTTFHVAPVASHRARAERPGRGATMTVAGFRAGLGVLAAGLGGCSLAPYQNVLGSFFPSWMLCVLAGIVATAIVHKVLVVARLAEVLPVPLLTYLAMTAAFTFSAWLAWLG